MTMTITLLELPKSPRRSIIHAMLTDNAAYKYNNKKIPQKS
jgi:hypothetical protein